MAKALPVKALIAITSYHGVIYPDGTKTGLFFTEALHPWEVLTQAGFEVDLATETGTYGLDDLSLTSQFLAGDDKSVFENQKHPFNVELNSKLKKASDLNKEDYGLFFASAGHAALYDYPTARGLQTVAGDVWDRGGIVAAVCHGPVILPRVVDSKTRKSIIEGKTVSGFTIEGEVILKVFEKLRSDKESLWSLRRLAKLEQTIALRCIPLTTTPLPPGGSLLEPIPLVHAARPKGLRKHSIIFKRSKFRSRPSRLK
jgi:putative intracellular protease/amidase